MMEYVKMKEWACSFPCSSAGQFMINFLMRKRLNDVKCPIRQNMKEKERIILVFNKHFFLITFIFTFINNNNN